MSRSDWAFLALLFIPAVAVLFNAFQFTIILLLWFFLVRPIHQFRIWRNTRISVKELKADLEVF